MTLRRWRRVASSAAAGRRPAIAVMIARCSGSDCLRAPWAQGQPDLAPDQLTLAGPGSGDDY